MPPYSSGIDRPNRPISFMSSTMPDGTSSCSSTASSAGTRGSRTKRCTDASSSSKDSLSMAMGLPMSGWVVCEDRLARSGGMASCLAPVAKCLGVLGEKVEAGGVLHGVRAGHLAQLRAQQELAHGNLHLLA